MGLSSVRPRREDDLDAIAAASRDPETLRWLDDPQMDAEARRAGMSRVEEAWRSGRAAPLTIADAAIDQAVGVINLQFRTKDVAAVAYSVFPTGRGQGLAPRAVLLVVDWVLRGLGVTQLILETDEVNRASIRSPRSHIETSSDTPLSAEGELPWGGSRLIIGTGAYGALPITAEVVEEASRRGVDLAALPTEDTCRLIASLDEREVYAVLHVTC